MTQLNKHLPHDELVAFCKRNHIVKFAVFGSMLRSDFGPKNDVDVLVEFKPESIPGYIGLAGMERELSELVGGRVVDMNTLQCLSHYFRDHVAANAKVLYDETRSDQNSPHACMLPRRHGRFLMESL